MLTIQNMDVTTQSPSAFGLCTLKPQCYHFKMHPSFHPLVELPVRFLRITLD